jgi:isocitrate dehydrogenase (NAD+)
MEVIQRVFRSELTVRRAALVPGIWPRGPACALDIKGKNIANPAAMIQAAVMMLHHISEKKTAGKISEAMETMLLKGEVLTPDLGGVATTKQFTQAIIREIEK